MGKNRSTLKGYFKKGAIPTESHFADLIDSMLIQEEDNVVKKPNNPLSIHATGPDEGLINFYRVEKGENELTWQIKQKGHADYPGLYIVDAAGNSRLFIDSKTGNVGIGTEKPEARLHIHQKEPGSSEKLLYVTSDFPEGKGVEFLHTNGSQGIGVSYNTIYATGNEKGHDLYLRPQDQGNVSVQGNLEVDGTIFGKLWYSDEYTYYGPEPVKMIDSKDGMAFLTYAKGEFEKDCIGVYIGDDGFWYLGSLRGGAVAGTIARARCAGRKPLDYSPPTDPNPLPKELRMNLILSLFGEHYRGRCQWIDTSGMGHYTLASSNHSMPKKYHIKDYNKKNFDVVRFDSKGGMCLSDSLNIAKPPFTIIIVDRHYGKIKGRTLQSRDTDKNWLLGKHGNSNGLHMNDSNKWIGKPQLAEENRFYINTATLSKDSSAVWYLDGKNNGSKPKTSSAHPGHLGFCKCGKYQDQPSEADIAAVLIWERVLDEEERKTVEKWLAEKYGITLGTS